MYKFDKQSLCTFEKYGRIARMRDQRRKDGKREGWQGGRMVREKNGKKEG